MDMLNEQWDKCLNLATYAFNILPSSDNSSSLYFLVFGKEPLDAELKELEELHCYSSSNCGLKQLQQLKEIWRAHINNLRNIRLHRARKCDKYAKELIKYYEEKMMNDDSLESNLLTSSLLKKTSSLHAGTS